MLCAPERGDRRCCESVHWTSSEIPDLSSAPILVDDLVRKGAIGQADPFWTLRKHTSILSEEWEYTQLSWAFMKLPLLSVPASLEIGQTLWELL